MSAVMCYAGTAVSVTRTVLGARAVDCRVVRTHRALNFVILVHVDYFAGSQ